MASSGQVGGLGCISTEDSNPTSLVDFQIPVDTTGCTVACVSARDPKSSLSKVWQFSFGVKSVENKISIIGVPKEVDSYGEPGTEGWKVTVGTVDDVFQLLVSGVDGLQINWAGYVDLVLVGG